MVLINNPIEFQMAMNAKLQSVLDAVMQTLLFKLQDIIENNVYSYQSDGEWDNRTYEFKNSWTARVPEWIGNYCESQIDNEDFNFTWNNERNMWSHGNSAKPIESNDDFNEIIDNRQGGGNFGFPSLQRHYWFEFLMYVDTSLESIFQAECIKQGIPVEYASVFLA